MAVAPAVLFFFLVAVAAAPDARSPYGIVLASRVIDTRDARPLLHLPQQGRDGRGVSPKVSQLRALLLVQFSSALTEQVKFEVRACFRVAGGGIISYVPNNALLVKASSLELGCLHQVPAIRWIGPFSSNDKVSPRLKDIPALLARADWGASPVTLSVSFVPDLRTTMSDLRLELMATWPSSRVSDSCSFLVADSSRLLLSCRELQLAEAVRWLSRHQSVLWIEPRLPSRAQLLYAKGLTWTSLPTAITFAPQPTFPLNGEGEVVGCADTGIDTDLSFFYDPTHPLPPYDVTDQNHRKVVTYVTVNADNGDSPGGHGSFVASEIVGQCIEPNASLAQYNGLAQGAKVAFVDISNGSDVNLLLPPSVYSGIYTYTYNAGARIHSDSWGGQPEGEVTSDTIDIDRFTWDHPDFLNVRAAGNSGYDHYGSVVSQATAKNALVVGSTITSLQGYLQYPIYNTYATNAPGLAAHLCPLNPTYCNYTFDPQAPPCNDTLLAPDLCPSYIAQQIWNDSVYLTPDSLSFFSAKGPTQDMRLKPDVCATGEMITAARARGYSTGAMVSPDDLLQNLLAEEGTSCSAPLAAAAATIVRQYLRLGYLPSGMPTPSDAVPAPRASTIKALLINSAQQLHGYTRFQSSWTPLANLPLSPFVGANYAYGFGRIALDRILYFADQGVPRNFTVIVASSEEDEISTGQIRAYCVAVGANAGVLRVTLVWNDFPGVAPLSMLQLQANLDLRVHLGESILLGNGIDDVVNNVEQVTSSVFPSQAIQVRVVGTSVPTENQRFSLVLSGPVGMTLMSDCIECTPGENLPCYIAHGTGTTRCSSAGRYGPCYVSTCDDGYSTSTRTNTCTAFASYYLVVGVGCGFFILLSVLLCVGLSCWYRAQRPALAGARDGRPELWDAFAVYYMRAPLFILGTSLSLTSAACSLVQPLFVGEVLRLLPTATQFSDIRDWFYYMLVFIVLGICLGSIGSFITSLAAARVLRDVRDVIFRTVLAMDLQKTVHSKKAALQTRILNDTASCVGFPSEVSTALFTALTNVVVGVIMAIYIAWQLGLVFLLVVPPAAGLSAVIGRLAQPQQARLLKEYSAMAEVAHDALAHAYLVKLFIREGQELDRFCAASNRYYHTSIVTLIIQTVGNAGTTTLLQLSAFALLWYGSVLVVQPAITTGLLFTFFLYGGLAATGISALAGVWPSYRVMLGAAGRVYALANLHDSDGAIANFHGNKPGREVGFSNPQIMDENLLSLYVRNLEFRYRAAAPGTFIFKSLSMTVKAGTVNAILGPSGSGKTSLLNLLGCVYHPTDGQILFNQTDLTQLPPTETYSRVVMLEQQPTLFLRTIWDNLLYGRSHAAQDEVEAACAAVDMLRYILAQPKGFHSVIGTDVDLSGGQSQRLAIARTMLATRAQVVLLDEPTSELDVQNEQRVLDYIIGLRGTKTVLFVTHSLHALERVDAIYFLQDGRVAECGSHSELCQRKGAYYQFLKISFQMSAPNGDFDAQVEKKSTDTQLLAAAPPTIPKVLVQQVMHDENKTRHDTNPT